MTGPLPLKPDRPARYGARESIALPFVVGLQHLPPGQRAVLLLRDVAGFTTAEVAAMRGSSEAAVRSALRRARVTLEARVPPDRRPAPPPHSTLERELVGGFARGFEQGDVEVIRPLLADDAFLMMPPYPLERRGPEAIVTFLAEQLATRAGRRVRLEWTRANGQPAFGHYIEAAQEWRALGVIALTLEGEKISGLTRFPDLAVLARLGLPRTLRL